MADDIQNPLSQKGIEEFVRKLFRQAEENRQKERRLDVKDADKKHKELVASIVAQTKMLVEGSNLTSDAQKELLSDLRQLAQDQYDHAVNTSGSSYTSAYDGYDKRPLTDKERNALEKEEEEAYQPQGLAEKAGTIFGDVFEGFGNLLNIDGIGGLLPSALSFGVFSRFIQNVDDTVDIYREFLKYGESFNGQMLGLHFAAATAAESIQRMQELMMEFGDALRVLGIENFAMLSKQIRNSAFGFERYGITTQQLNDATAQYLDMMLNAGDIDANDQADFQRRLQQGEMQSAIEEFIKGAYLIADVTGQGLDKVLDQLKGNVEDLDLNALMLSLGLDNTQIEKVNAAMLIFERYLGDAGAEAVKSFLRTGDALAGMTTDQQEQLAQALGGDLSQLNIILDQALRGGQNIEEFSLMSLRRMQSMSKTLADDEDRVRTLSLIQNTIYGQMLRASRSFDESQMDPDEQDEITQSMLEFQRVFAEFRTELYMLGIKVLAPVLKVLTVGLKGINAVLKIATRYFSSVNTMIDNLGKTVQKLREEGNWLIGIFDGLGSVFGKVGDVLEAGMNRVDSFFDSIDKATGELGSFKQVLTSVALSLPLILGGLRAITMGMRFVRASIAAATNNPIARGLLGRFGGGAAGAGQKLLNVGKGVGGMAIKGLGKVLLPIGALLSAVEGINVAQMLGDDGELAAALSDGSVGLGDKIAGGVGGALNAFLLGIPDWVVKNVFGGDSLAKVFVHGYDGVKDAIGGIGDSVGSMLSGVKGFFGRVKDGAFGIFDRAKENIGGFFGSFGEMIGGIFNGDIAKKLVMTSPLGQVIRLADRLSGGRISSAFGGALGDIGFGDDGDGETQNEVKNLTEEVKTMREENKRMDERRRVLEGEIVKTSKRTAEASETTATVAVKPGFKGNTPSNNVWDRGVV